MKILIISGGELDSTFLQNYCSTHKNDLIIAVDKGLEALQPLGILPHHIVGDFDSVSASILQTYQKNTSITLHSYKPEKDYTDTNIALNLAISLQASHITILGALGKRFDHALANLHILTTALHAHIPCEILDTNNRIYLIQNSLTLQKSNLYGKYLSLIPLTSSVKGLSLKGFKYPLENYELTIGKSLGISNEIIEEKATITLTDGILVVIESKDGDKNN